MTDDSNWSEEAWSRTLDAQPSAAPASVVEQGAGAVFNPGHYLIDYSNGTRSTSTFAFANSTENVKGIFKRYNWDTVHLASGMFDFSLIEEDLAELGADKQIFPYFGFHSFGAAHRNKVPEWMNDDPQFGGDSRYYGCMTNDNAVGTQPTWWNSNTVREYKAMLSAFAALYADDPRIEAIGMEETAASQVMDYPGKSASGTIAGMKEITKHAMDVFPMKHVFWYFNWAGWFNLDLVGFYEELKAYGSTGMTCNDAGVSFYLPGGPLEWLKDLIYAEGDAVPTFPKFENPLGFTNNPDWTYQQQFEWWMANGNPWSMLHIHSNATPEQRASVESTILAYPGTPRSIEYYAELTP